MPYALLAESNEQTYQCMDKAIRRIIDIRSFPDIPYLHTLDGQTVLLKQFYAKCFYLFPQCSLFDKFYYWQSEIKEVTSSTRNGDIRHKIRSYNNCLSTICPERCDPRKIHGDVAEFYDRNGIFMGLSVYMGDGKYCALPYDGYRK
jgi:hypothetical protein